MLNMYDISIPPLQRNLHNLSSILKKGEAYAKAKDIDPTILLNARLFVDMYPLTRQVQIATDMSKGAAARLAGIDIPKYEDNEASFEELQMRIDKTLNFLSSVQPSQVQDSETREVVITIRDIDLHFTGLDYLLKWVMPNVYFHVTTAYDILRHQGVALGKSDYLGPRK
jgi:uncharacterized protein